jgi:hypothetical protein
MKKHLAVFSKEGVAQILTGKKTVETRFSKKNIPPFGMVNSGDLIYIKESGGAIKGQAVVKSVLSFEKFSEDDLTFIKKTYGKKISLGSKEDDEKYFEERKDSVFLTVIFLDKVEEFITPPIKPIKKDLRGWVIL